MFRLRALLASLVSCLAVGPLWANLVIHEIHFDPPDNTVPEEFVELFNDSDEAVDLGGWFLADGVRHEFAAGTTIAPRGYLVVAGDPATLEASFGISGVLGPWEGRLANEGERLTLRRPDGSVEDSVDYGIGFPWPVASSGDGASMELVDASLDNDLGGSWRASGLVDRPFRERVYLVDRETNWRYRPATEPPSDPATAWRQPGFTLDASWLEGPAPIGFGDDDDQTELLDMRDNYSGVFLLRRFDVVEVPSVVKLGAYYDDGCVVWINGVEVARLRAPEGELAFDAEAASSHEAVIYDEIELRGADGFLVAGENTIAIHAMNLRATSADFSIDAELFVPGTADEDQSGLLPPTPGAPNASALVNAPPQVRQVDHFPGAPTAADPILVTAKATDPDGVGAVELLVQIVAPGAFVPAVLPLPVSTLLSRPTDPFEPNPEFEDPASWTVIAMRDDGESGDLLANDGVFTATIPAQAHRTLVRYRIRASDARGERVTVPFRDDPSLNFAAFVYDGVPPYVASTRSVHPEGAGHVYDAPILQTVPVYHVLTRGEDMTQCVAYSGSFQIPKSNERARDRFNWECAFVYDGIVYDHVRYRLRQANDRYGGSGKRSMRFRFNRGRWLEARDNWGRKFPRAWRTLNTGKGFDNKRVGNFGLSETMNSRLWNLMGVPAPEFFTFHLRVIDADEENDQYLGDFWGLFQGIEDYDPRFLDSHDLDDGNLYKLKDGQFNGNDLKRHQGRVAVANDADFQNIRRNLRPTQTEEWLDRHVNYDRWYAYHAVVEGIRHYDFVPADSHSKNRAWYFEPVDEPIPEDGQIGRLWTLPWDSDASWGPNWNDGTDYSKNAIFGGGGKPRFKIAYRNRIREFRDLVWNEETIEPMIDEIAANFLELAKADRDRWRGAPAIAGSQDFGPIETKIVDMKRFAFVGWSGSTGPTVPAGGRARHLENLANAEGDAVRIPETPVVLAVGAVQDELAQDALVFEVSAFADPNEDDTFGGIEWRAAEVEDRSAPGFDPFAPTVREASAVWQSGRLDVFASPITIPRTALAIGHRYRVRARVYDSTDRASHWSEPVEFSVSPPSTPTPQALSLRITEMMFHPPDDEALEFIEIQNIGTQAVDLDGVALADGIRFDFKDGAVRTLGAGEHVLVVASLDVFSRRHDVSRLLVAGQYSGQLANDGERIELRHGIDGTILAFEYSDLWEPLTDGLGYSLVVRDPLDTPSAWGSASGWRASARPGGSPGAADVELADGFQRPANINQDSRIDITDAVVLLGILVGGNGDPLPCGDGRFEHASNQALLDVNGDAGVNLTDAVHILLWLFRQGPGPALGTECVPIAECPNVCG